MNKEDFYSSDETAKKLGVSRPTVLRWIEEGKISPSQVRKLGRLTKIKKEYIDQIVGKLDSGELKQFP